MGLPYFQCCVDFRQDDVAWLEHIIDNSREISFETLRRHVDRDSLASLTEHLGYNAETAKIGLRINTDPCVRFHSAKCPQGEPVYFIVHSAIEYLFTRSRPNLGAQPDSAHEYDGPSF